jgi:hypothetical protein
VSLKIDSVAITSAGMIVHWTPKRGYVRYSMTEPDAQKEVTRIFGWVAMVDLHPRTPNDQRLKIFMDLQANALEISSRVSSEGNDAAVTTVV